MVHPLTVTEAPGNYFNGNGSNGSVAVPPQALATGATAALNRNTLTKSGNSFAG